MNDYEKNCPLEDCPPCFVRNIIINLIKRVNGHVKHTNLYPDLKYIYILFCRGSIVLNLIFVQL